MSFIMFVKSSAHSALVLPSLRTRRKLSFRTVRKSRYCIRKNLYFHFTELAINIKKT